MVKRSLLLHLWIFAIAFLLAGCQRTKDEVLLRYTPQVGSTYSYKLEFIDYLDVTGEIQVLSEENGGYKIHFTGTLPDELISGSMIITDRHNTSNPGYISLNFPDDPVGLGEEWEGEIPWYFEHYYVLDPTKIHVPASYKLLAIEQGENGRIATIEQIVETDTTVDGMIFHVGQVGVRWDSKGKITEVNQDYDAFGKLQVGDVVVGLNGQKADTAGDLRILAENHIQHPKGSKTVIFTILRDGQEHDIGVEKSIDELAIVKVFDERDVVRIAYDVDRGILMSAEVRSRKDISFTSLTTDTFPIVDDYGGFHKFGYLQGRTDYQYRYGSDEVAWILSLVE